MKLVCANSQLLL